MTLSGLSSQIIRPRLYKSFPLSILPCITSINIIVTSLQIGFHKLWSVKSISELILILETFLLLKIRLWVIFATHWRLVYLRIDRSYIVSTLSVELLDIFSTFCVVRIT